MDYSQDSTQSITEITSGDYHIIIQPWINYHYSLVHLSSLPLSKSRIAAFFGHSHNKLDIINLLNNYQFDVWELVSSPSGSHVSIHPYNKNYHDDDGSTLHIWIQENFELTNQGVIQK